MTKPFLFESFYKLLVAFRINTIFLRFNKMSRNGNSNNFIDVFRPMYILTRCYGLFPYSINWKLNEPFVSKIDFFIFALHILLYAGYTVLNLYCDTNKSAKLPEVLRVGNRINLICGISSGVAAITMDLLNREKIRKIFQKFENFDRVV